MEKSLQVFDFESKQVRWTLDENNEPWFVVKDVAEATEYSKTSTPAALVSAVPEEWKGIKPIHTPGGMQDMTCLSEQGVYFFLARSDKPAALSFQKKIAGEILPSISVYYARLVHPFRVGCATVTL